MLLHINPTRQRGKRTGSLARASGWYMTFFAAGIIMTGRASVFSNSREGAWRRGHPSSCAWHGRAGHGNHVADSDGPAIESSWEWVSRTPRLQATLRGRDRRRGVRGLAALLPQGRTEWDLHLRAPHATQGARRICAHDDRFRIVGPGDETRLEFEAAGLPPLPAGWTRAYVSRACGYCNDVDPFTAAGDTIEPLPWRGMPAFPFAAGVTRPAGAAHDDDLCEFQTRPAGGVEQRPVRP